MRICVLANSSRYIWNFRINLIEALRAAGHEVFALSPQGAEVPLIEARNIRHVHVPLAPKSINPLSEIQTVRTLRNLLRIHQADVVLTSTPKGNIYAAIANLGTRRRQIANVSGLGSAHLRQDWLSRFVDTLYGLTFKRIHYVFFENPTDHIEFTRRGWVQPSRTEVIPGLGVDLEHFGPRPWPAVAGGEIRFLMIARLISDKGVREFVEAARLVRQEHPMAHFSILGDSAADNPTSIPAQEVARWVADGHVVHHEHTNDVRPYISQSHCVVLPSYREGMSRTLLEAGAMGRPLIASDVPGCREAVVPGSNGLLCRPRSAESLAEQINRFLSLTQAEQEAMGTASRLKIAAEFDERIVLQRYLSVLNTLTSDSRPFRK